MHAPRVLHLPLLVQQPLVQHLVLSAQPLRRSGNLPRQAPPQLCQRPLRFLGLLAQVEHVVVLRAATPGSEQTHEQDSLT